MADSIGLGISAIANHKIENNLGEILFISGEINTSTGLAMDGKVKLIKSLSFTKEIKSVAGFELSSYGYSYTAIKESDSVPTAAVDAGSYYKHATLSVKNAQNSIQNTSVNWIPVLSTDRKSIKVYFTNPSLTNYTLINTYISTSINLILFYSDDVTYV